MVSFRPVIGDESGPPPVSFPPPRATPSPSPHQALQTWSYGVPSPPRVYVAPPSVNDSGNPELEFVKRTGRDFESNGFANSDFLKTVTYGHFNLRDNVMDWEYEERRVAQEILPFMYLGPVSAAKDKKFLRDKQITMVMAVRDTLSAQAKLLSPKAPRDLGIHSISIDVSGNPQLIAAFPRAIEAINSHLSTRYQKQQAEISTSIDRGQTPSQPVPGRVLVFCESGNERSVAVVVAYIMAMYSTTLGDALQAVQSQRFCISVNDPCRYLLQSYEDILQAKRDVAKFRMQYENSTISEASTAGPGRATFGSFMPKSVKRTLDDAYADSMDVDEDEGTSPNDDSRFEKREGLAPFMDRIE